jgi:hypothetical protein
MIELTENKKELLKDISDNELLKKLPLFPHKALKPGQEIPDRLTKEELEKLIETIRKSLR